ncbi:NAD(P)/FAD-dependent oxidoreductase [Thalassovita mangrovi]|uniref:FAD-dependent oxidoreductase n=1 Tax=Thalassovita mangrovi TaxID=2692236 RepID=A0A6L8LK06_9RHOB|nr:FAD-dependent oxidoreductase [Thalassovita mangrovi]MYM56378.1 FAD-dependent oxidoreductase [Thalassovita mangrovi]
MIANETPVLANSLWTATAQSQPEYAPLYGSTEAEVAIIGAGVTGLSAALHLAERGIDTVVLEAATPGWGASGRNGGQLNPGLKYDPDAVTAHFGEEMGARMLRLSGGAPDLAMDLIARHRIACDAVQSGWIQPAHDAGSLRVLEARAEQWARHGVSLRMLDRETVARMIGTDVYTGGLLDPRGANLHPLNYTLGLARAAQATGARIYGGTRAVSLNKTDSYQTIATTNGSVRARRVLLCTNAETDALCPPLARTVVPVRSVQVATAPLPDEILDSILPGRQAASDSRRVMVYYKRDGAGRFLIGGRGDYNDTTTAKLQENLRRISRKMFPQLGDVPFTHAWGGHVAMTADHLPHLSRHGEGVMSATGFNGRGLALGTAIGKLLADWASGTPEAELDFPVTPARPIPFHFLRKPAVRAAVVLFRLRDSLGI